jgi:hypothetical protein
VTDTQAWIISDLGTYPDVDHFDIYDGAQHEKLVADQLAFLRRHLQPGEPANIPVGSRGSGR